MKSQTLAEPVTVERHVSGLKYFAVLAMFLASGGTSLIYEVIWIKLLSLTFGVSVFAVSAVVIAFMAGLAGGSFLFGRLSDRRTDQLRLYGLLQLLIGIYACMLPLMLEHVGELYVLIYRWFQPGFWSLSMIRLALSVLLLLVPTVLMGGTLPLLTALVAGSEKTASRRTATLYGLNTLGAVIGCLAAGFVLIPKFGMTTTTFIASGVNAAICIASLWLHRTWRPVAAPAWTLPKQPAARTTSAKPRAAAAVPQYAGTAAIVAIGVSGLTAMAYQTIWTRVLSMVAGTTTYAFTTILAAFLLGIVIGSILHAARPTTKPLLALALAQMAIGTYVLFLMPKLDHLPFVFLKVFDWSNHSWSLFQFGRFGLLCAIMLVPTVLFGLSFPLVVQIAVRQAAQTGRKVGSVCGVNTIGAIVGSFLGPFVFIPVLGFQKGMLVLASVNVTLGLALIVLNFDLPVKRRAALAVAGIGVFVLAVAMLCPWQIQYLNSGTYVYASDYNHIGGADRLKAALKSYDVLYYREGPAATVSVLESPDGTLSLSIDGKTDASTGTKADMSTQILLSHLPALFVEKPDDALMIGVGSGVSLGSLLRYRVKNVEAVEISPAVVEASRLFRQYNYDALNDPRVKLIVGDGRNHLKRTGKAYDLIVSQPSNPWIAGVADLFTREYYRLMAQRLKPGGVVCQWVPSYHMSKEMLAVVCKTFRQEFPHVSLWTSSVVGDLFLIGSNRPLGLSYELFQERLARPEIAADLERVGMNHPAMLAMTFKFGKKGLDRFLAEFPADLPENTDKFPVIEYMTPRFLLTQRVAKDFNRRSDLSGDHAQLLKMVNFPEEEQRQAFASQIGQLANEM